MSTGICISDISPINIGGLFVQTGNSTPITNTIVETTLINGGIGTLTVPAVSYTHLTLPTILLV